MDTLNFGELKPVVSALIQPPGSLLLIILAALTQWRRARTAAVAVIGLCSVLLWLICCPGTAVWLQDRWLQPPTALSGSQIEGLRAQPGTDSIPTAIVVLGSGRIASAPEYGGQSSLTPHGMERLRYGVWLARKTGLPLGYSGGVGWAQGDGPSEAETAARIVRDEQGLEIRWVEGRSRDTRENANSTVRLLRADQVERIVLVTHAAHMPRALRAFRQAAGTPVDIIPAPVIFAQPEDRPIFDWLPSAHGFQAVHALLHELLGLLAGA